jgi:hypothetical protein
VPLVTRATGFGPSACGATFNRTVLPNAEDRAAEIFGHLAAGRWEAAGADFGECMRELVDALGEAGLATTCIN